MTNVLRAGTNRSWLLLAASCVLVYGALSADGNAADEYPDTWIRGFRAECMAPQKGDTSPQARAAYCDCYQDLVKKSVPWRDAQLLDLALSANGEGAFEAKEKAIGDKVTNIINYCKVKSGLVP